MNNSNCQKQIRFKSVDRFDYRPCKWKAMYVVEFRYSSRGAINRKQLCKAHMNAFVKELKNDSFAELISVEEFNPYK